MRKSVRGNLASVNPRSSTIEFEPSRDLCKTFKFSRNSRHESAHFFDFERKLERTYVRCYSFSEVSSRVFTPLQFALATVRFKEIAKRAGR
jgi:hypothetical protein